MTVMPQMKNVSHFMTDYSLEEDDMIFDKNIDSTIEWVGFKGKSRDNQVKRKPMELGVASNMLAMFPNNTQGDDCATSDEELMSLHGDSDDENPKRSIVLNPARNLEDPKFKFAPSMIFSVIAKNSSGQLRYMLCYKKQTSSLKKMKVRGRGQFVRCQAANGSYLYQRLIKMNLSTSRQ
ncbi:uncharacterized protein LOC132045937 [Lycium ferocissimum]|uniref:uncharacterized protein LOC132045937 n=1 Tax=Lycium ferocissimum TaxID=112874 RepID=UPI0028163F3B|nr:uncharacterized protein LOC132045937 [Lycium ferocissimum]